MSDTAFNPKAIEDFQNAILSVDPTGVWRALEAGVDPATPLRANTGHPLGLLMQVTYQSYVNAQKERGVPAEIKDENEYNERITDIVSLLLAKGAKLVEEEKYTLKNLKYLVDTLMLGTVRPVDMSTVIVHAIHESLEEKGVPYVFDVPAFMEAYAAVYKTKDGMTKGLNTLEMMHKIVGKRLAEPLTEEEQQLVRKHKGKLDFWLKPFDRPEMKDVLEYPGVKAALDKTQPAASVQRGAAAAQSSAASAESPMAQFIQKLGEDGKTPDEVLADMDALTGLANAKRNARRLMLRVQLDDARKEMGLPASHTGHHTVFDGPPGTGKTTLARHKAELLHALGIVGENYVEISRENLVGKYIGHTESNMVDLIKNADVIFIDEAYNLVSDKDDKKDFGNRVVDALMTALENRRDTLTVFFAGYPEPMKEFLASNPGLLSRITHYEHIEAPTTEELGEIMDGMLAKNGYTMQPEARAYALTQLEAMKAAAGDRDFGNARVVRSLIEQLPDALAERLDREKGQISGASKKRLSTFTKEDVMSLNMGTGIAVKKKPGIGFNFNDRIGQPAGMSR